MERDDFKRMTAGPMGSRKSNGCPPMWDPIRRDWQPGVELKQARCGGARVETRKTVERDLYFVELDLAEKLSLPQGTNMRVEIIRRLRNGEMRETEPVAKWHRLYSALMRWIEEGR